MRRWVIVLKGICLIAVLAALVGTGVTPAAVGTTGSDTDTPFIGLGTPTPVIGRAFVSAEAVYLLEEPIAGSTHLGEAVRGAELQIVDQTEQAGKVWFLVTAATLDAGVLFYRPESAQQGWLNSAYVSFDGSFAPTPTRRPTLTPTRAATKPMAPRAEVQNPAPSVAATPFAFDQTTIMTICGMLLGLIIVIRISAVRDWTAAILGVIFQFLRLITMSVGTLAFLAGLIIAAYGLAGYNGNWTRPWAATYPAFTWIMAIYLANSVLALIVFGWDALMGSAGDDGIGTQWRVGNHTLHALEFFGGWPTAWLILLIFRFKSGAFLITSIVITVLHGLFWMWLNWRF